MRPDEPKARLEQASLLSELLAMPNLLAASFETLSALEAAAPGPDGAFSPVEHCWHLADLEREGYAVRIRRLREETNPWLPDFNGDEIARERNYRSLSLVDGLAAFRGARLHNVATLRALDAGDWMRRGEQEGVGAIALCDIPAMMAEHDAAHRREIQEWQRVRRARQTDR